MNIERKLKTISIDDSILIFDRMEIDKNITYDRLVLFRGKEICPIAIIKINYDYQVVYASRGETLYNFKLIKKEGEKHE